MSLTALGAVARPREKHFLRCLYAHRVEDHDKAHFQRLLEALMQYGTFVDTDTTLDILCGARPLDGRYFHLSFDDGFACLHRNALGVLESVGISAAFFVPTRLLDQQNPCQSPPAAPNSQPCQTPMTWDMVREIDRLGHDVCSHTRTHVRLSDVSASAAVLDEEIVGSKRDLQEALGKECRYISWPFGTMKDIDRTSLEKVEQAGYAACFSAVRGKVQPGATSPMIIPRHHIEGHWPWLHVKYFALGGGRTRRESVRIVILTSSRTGTASRCLTELHRAEGVDIAMVVLNTRESGIRKRNRKRILRKVAKIGILGALNGIRIRKWFRREPAEDIGELTRRLGIRLETTPAISHDRTRELFREADADLGLSLGNGYIPASVFTIPPLGMLNMHGEILPRFQNALSVVWAIHEGIAETGFTIHKIDKHVDTGDILYQERFPIVFEPSLEQTVRMTVAEVSQHVPKAMAKVVADYKTFEQNAIAQKPGRAYTTPTLWQFLRMRRQNKRLARQSARSAAASD